MDIFGSDILQVDAIDSSAAFHVVRHLWRSDDIAKSQGWILLQFFRVAGSAGKIPLSVGIPDGLAETNGLGKTLGIDLFNLFYDFEQAAAPGIP